MCFAEIGVRSIPWNSPLGIARGSASARDADASVELLKQQTEANQKAALKSLLHPHASRSKVLGRAFEAAVVLFGFVGFGDVPDDDLVTVFAPRVVHTELVRCDD